MKIAMLGDIHGNIEALDAVFSALDGESCDAVYHVGDVVGYCTNFEDVIQRLRQNNIRGVVGNHELMVTGGLSTKNCIAKDSIQWTSARISKQDKEFIMALPSSLRLGDMIIFHAEPESCVNYISSVERAEQAFKALDKKEPGWRVAFHGHTHKQRIFERKGEKVSLVLEGEGEIKLEPTRQYLACPGSVGVSRDLDPRTGYMIYAEDAIRQYRVDYNWHACQRKLDQAGLKTQLFRKRAQSTGFALSRRARQIVRAIKRRLPIG